MRILTGYLKGRRIKFPKSVRPTQQKVRKAIFDILGQEIKESRFLELFAGSGAVGIEALSNGAQEVVFVENNRNCLRVLMENIEDLRISNYEVLSIDSIRVIERFHAQGKTFNIIFLDPPYFKDLAQKTLQTISMCDILVNPGIIIVEHHKKDILDKQFSDITFFKQRRYGEKCLSFFRAE